MRLIIIGASGLIGSCLYTAARGAGHIVIGTFTGRLAAGLIHFDLRTQSLRELVPDLGRSDVVYLLSAYSNPTWIHANAAAARELNIVATKKVIDETNRAGARAIFMSSVEVFDGRSGNYHEDAAPNPLNLYGRMKHEIELHLTNAVERSCIVRTGWNVGWNATHRCVVKLTYETLVGVEARMANDNTFSISDTQDTAAGLLWLADQPKLTKLHLASSPYFVRTQLADLIISSSTHNPRMAYQPVSFADIPYSEPRARLNHLDNRRAIQLGLTFRDAHQIVRDKVSLLDSARATHAA